MGHEHGIARNGLVIVIAALAACCTGCHYVNATSRQFWLANQAYDCTGFYSGKTESQYDVVMRHVETVADMDPNALARGRQKNTLKRYRQSRIGWAYKQAEEAKRRYIGRLYDVAVEPGTAPRAALAGDLEEAWYYLVQASVVEDENPKCERAKVDAEEVRRRIMRDYLNEFERSIAQGGRGQAFEAAIRSIWFGAGEDGFAALAKTVQPLGSQEEFCQLCPVSSMEVESLLKTYSFRYLRRSPVFFSPYRWGKSKHLRRRILVRHDPIKPWPKGEPRLPVYFCDPPCHYIPIGEIRVEGVPLLGEVRPEVVDEYDVTDSLKELTEVARQKEHRDIGVNALINVRVWTKTKKSYTIAEMVHLLEPCTCEPGPPHLVTAFSPEQQLLAEPTIAAATADENQTEMAGPTALPDGDETVAGPGQWRVRVPQPGLIERLMERAKPDLEDQEGLEE